MTATWVDDLERELLPDEHAQQWTTPGKMAQHFDDRTVQTPALDLIDEFLVDLATTPDGRGILIMPPQEGKSQRGSRWFPTWMLKRNPDLRIAMTSAEHKLARRFGRQVRDTVREHSEPLGLTISSDLSGQAEWQLAGYDGGVYAVGIGGGLTGRPADVLVIDDPIKNRKQADSDDYRDMVWEWWTDVASTRLAPGAPVLLILTRWHHDDLAGRLLAAEDGHRWKVLRIPAQADHDPEKGETDPLGREPGEFLESARGRTTEQWEAIKVNAGSRTWSAMYQGKPSPESGGMFPRDRWQQYDTPQWVVRDDGSRWVTSYDEILASWDLTFKDTAGTDMVVGQVWMRRGADAFLLDQVRRRMDFPATCQAFRHLSAKWPQAVVKLVEDKANGPAVIASLNRTVPGIIPEEPDGSKTARAAAVSPLQESGNVWLPAPELERDEAAQESPYAWVGDYIEEHAAFPFGQHDDQVDGTSQALKRLVLVPLWDGSIVTDSDLDDELEGFQIAPY